MPQRDTVAGEATARSCASKIIDMTSDIAMISPDMRQSFLLSSSTVFMFSIQIASTGPSNMTHLRSGVRVHRAVAVDDGEDAVRPLVRDSSNCRRAGPS